MTLNAKEMARNIAEMENFKGKNVLLLGEMCELATALTEAGANVTTCEYRDGTERNEEWNALPKMEKSLYEMENDDVKGTDIIIIASPQHEEYEAPLYAYEIAPAGCMVIYMADEYSLSSCSYKIDKLFYTKGFSQFSGFLSTNTEEIHTNLVRLFKEGEGDDEFSGYLIGQPDAEASVENGGCSADMYENVRALVSRYMEGVRQYDQAAEMMAQLKETIIIEKETEYLMEKRFEIVTDGRVYPHTDNRHDFKKNLRAYFWKVVLQKSSIFRFATRKNRKMLEEFVNMKANYPFTMRNVLEALSLIERNSGEWMQQAFEEVFDNVADCKASNTTDGAAPKLNRRFVIDGMRYVYDFDTDYVRVSCTDFSGAALLDDFARILCWLTGKDYSSEDSLYRFCCDNKLPYGEWFDWTFFRIKVYKKGTAHVEFKDDELVERFNRFIARRRGYELAVTPAKKVAKRKAS